MYHSTVEPPTSGLPITGNLKKWF